MRTFIVSARLPISRILLCGLLIGMLSSAVVSLPALSASERELGYDTLSFVSRNAPQYHYIDASIIRMATRFSLARPCFLHTVIVATSGDSGSFALRVVGDVGGLCYPAFEHSLTKKIIAKKHQVGYQAISVELGDLPISSTQFFIVIEDVSHGLNILTDNENHKAECAATNAAGQYFNQTLQGRDGQWKYSKRAFNISVLVKKAEVIPFFERDTTVVSQMNAVVGKNASLSVVDINQDGYDDLVASGRVFLSKKGRNFEQSALLSESGFETTCSIALDANNDSKTDVVCVEVKGHEYLLCTYLQDQTGKLELSTKISLPLSASPSCFSLGDYNRDANLDIFLGFSGTSRGYLLASGDGRGGFSYASADALKMDALDVTGCQFVDVDGDGCLELCLSALGSDSTSRKWIVSWPLGSAALARSFDADRTSASRLSKGMAWWDINSDGNPELIAAESINYLDEEERRSRTTTVLENSGSPLYAVSASPSADLAFHDGQSSVAWLDADNDARVDCIVSTDCRCRYVQMLRQCGAHCFEDATLGSGIRSLTNNVDVAVIDYDNDGRQDIITIQNDSLYFFKNVSSAGNYINISTCYLASHGWGLGSSVKVYSDATVQCQQIVSGKGLLVQDSPLLHFGLGSATKVDSIVVTKGDNKLVFPELPANQTVDLNARTSKTGVLQLSSYELKCEPNPFSGSLYVSFRLPFKSLTTVEVYDLKGSVVKRLLSNQTVEPGGHDLAWDASDEGGQKCPPGTYIIKIKSNLGELSSVVVRVP